jgi:ABC-type transporter Mla MlaB component
MTLLTRLASSADHAHSQDERPERGASPMTPLTVAPLVGRNGFRLCGEVDLSSRPTLENALRRLDEDGDVHVDLAEVTFIDVGGMTALVNTATRLPADQRLVLHHPPAHLRSVVRLMWRGLRTIQMVAS